MQYAELVVGTALCLAGGDFHISMRNSYFEHIPERSGCWCVAKKNQNYFNSFLNPARRRRDGVKEDYYVQEIDLSNLFCVVVRDSSGTSAG